VGRISVRSPGAALLPAAVVARSDATTQTFFAPSNAAAKVTGRVTASSVPLVSTFTPPASILHLLLTAVPAGPMRTEGNQSDPSSFRTATDLIGLTSIQHAVLPVGVICSSMRTCRSTMAVAPAGCEATTRKTCEWPAPLIGLTAPIRGAVSLASEPGSSRSHARRQPDVRTRAPTETRMQARLNLRYDAMIPRVTRIAIRLCISRGKAIPDSAELPLSDAR